jgi:hypothetical protein
MGARSNKIVISDFYCTVCGNRNIPLARSVNQQRESGHLKKLYCLKCRTETNCAEVRPHGSYTKEDFDEEFSLGRFVNGNRIPVEDLLICSKTDCKYNKNGRCWNSNYSNKECKHRV